MGEMLAVLIFLLSNDIVDCGRICDPNLQSCSSYLEIRNCEMISRPITETHVTFTECAGQCHDIPGCHSFNFVRETNNCQLFGKIVGDVTTDIRKSLNTDLYTTYAELLRSWQIVYKWKRGDTVSPLYGFLGRQPSSSRLEILNCWSSLRIKKVLMQIKKDDNPYSYVNVVFDGTNSSITSWFTKDRILKSSWRWIKGVDIVRMESPDKASQFQIAYNPGDSGFLQVATSGHGSRSDILYSPTNGSFDWNDGWKNNWTADDFEILITSELF